MKQIITLIVASLFVLMSACRTTEIREIDRIVIPPGLTSRDVKAAMVLAVTPESAPAGSSWEKIVDSVFSARFWGYKSQFERKSDWFVESIEPDAVVFGFHDQPYYLRVRMDIKSGAITPTIDGSSNLKQSGHSIHKNAYEWIDDLSVRIRAQLGRVSALKESLIGTPEAQATRQ